PEWTSHDHVRVGFLWGLLLGLGLITQAPAAAFYGAMLIAMLGGASWIAVLLFGGFFAVGRIAIMVPAQIRAHLLLGVEKQCINDQNASKSGHWRTLRWPQAVSGLGLLISGLVIILIMQSGRALAIR